MHCKNDIRPVTVSDMAAARDRRAAIQGELLRSHGVPLVCLSMNIAGEIKLYPLVRNAFYEGVRRIRESIAPLEEHVVCEFTGCEAFFCVAMDAKALKERMTKLEENDELGRLFDIDVLDAHGEKLSRGVMRRCLICSEAAAICARSRAHTLEELKARTDNIIRSFFAKKAGAAAFDALIREVETTPKPGLVDRNNSGAHRDMDINTFYASARALRPYFEEIALTAFEHADHEPRGLMELLRPIGIRAQEAMLAATGGVNTHKGLIYTLGLMCASYALCMEKGIPVAYMPSVCAEIVGESAERELENAARRSSSLTHGEAIYAASGARGVRGEAAGGMKSAVSAAKLLRYYSYMGLDGNDSQALTLIHIMAELSDTNVLYRTGESGLSLMRSRAQALLELPARERLNALRALDDEFIALNLSPGGCADVLCAAIMMTELN